MSVCSFIASDSPLKEFVPSKEYPFEINIDNGSIYDGGADDNYYLKLFKNVSDYTSKKYGVYLEWNYTCGRAEQIIQYIKAALLKSDSVEFWRVWLIDYYEYEERPFIHKRTVAIEDLTVEHIKAIDSAVIWNTPDTRYPERPSFYCLTITK